MKISALHMPVDVYIFRYRPAHEAFVDKRKYHIIWKRDLSLPLHAQPFTGSIVYHT